VKSNNFAAGTLQVKFAGSGTAFRCVPAYFNPWTDHLDMPRWSRSW